MQDRLATNCSALAVSFSRLLSFTAISILVGFHPARALGHRDKSGRQQGSGCERLHEDLGEGNSPTAPHSRSIHIF